MRRALALFLALYGLSATDPYAQTVPTRPVTDDSNSAASTAFVKNVLGALSGDCTINPATLVVTCTGGGGGSLVVGTTPITGGVNGDCLYDNGPGTLGEKACGGTAVGYVQDFIEGTDFTTGVTTQLTLTNPPATAANLQIFFDGTNQSANTWSFNTGTGVVTFNQAITASFVVEARSVVATGAGTGNVTTGGTLSNGNIVTGAGGVSVQDSGYSAATVATTATNALSTATTALTTAQQAAVINVLPNTQYQLWTTSVPSVEQLSSGTGPESVATCSAFQTTNNQPQFTCSNTGQIRVGDIVVTNLNAAFWDFAGAGTIGCSQVECLNGLVTASRVNFLTANTSITIQGYFGGVSPASSSAQQLTPLGPGGVGADPDGWDSSSTLAAFADNWPINAYPGQIRSLLLRKGITGSEYIEYTAPQQGMGRYWGKTYTCGGVVWQKLQQGSGTWNFYISDSVNGSTSSATGTGQSYSGPNGGYQFLTVTHTIGVGATNWKFGLNTLGNSGDIYYGAGPWTCVPGTTLSQNQLAQIPNELIRASTHWNPPLLTPLIVTIPATEIVTGSGLYGWNFIDLQAVSIGVVDGSIGSVIAKIEWTTSHVGAYVLTGDEFAIPGLTFGPETITNVSGVANVGSTGPWPVDPAAQNGQFYSSVAIVSNVPSLAITSGTFDFTNVEAVMPSNYQ